MSIIAAVFGFLALGCGLSIFYAKHVLKEADDKFAIYGHMVLGSVTFLLIVTTVIFTFLKK